MRQITKNEELGLTSGSHMERENEIKRTIRYIEAAFRELDRNISIYESNENTISNNLERLQNIIRNPLINPATRSGYELMFNITDANYRIKCINDRILREIDTTTAFIAGNLSVLIEECMRSYSHTLKINTRRLLQQLDDRRKIKVNEYDRYIPFPVAVGILSPYMTKILLSDQPHNLLSLRHLIRALCDSSY